MHRFKYKGQTGIGLKLGQMLGRALEHSNFPPTDLVIPVPLHPKKKRERGYNQSEWIARGISETLNKPLCDQILFRSGNNPSQTKQTRQERWDNIHNAFGLKNPGQLEGQHILLVDDIITTGATLEACAYALINVPGIRISIATLAAAER